MQGGAWSLNGSKSVRQSIEKCLTDPNESVSEELHEFAAIRVPKENKNQYDIAYKTGIELAQKMVENGAKTLLEEAKAQVRQSRDE